MKKSLDSPHGRMELFVEIDIPKGTIATLYGSSGAGKTSTLRLIAGLLEPDSGSIMVEGDCWYDSQRHINRGARSREVGFVFQNYALFPNMTVQQNLDFALPKNQSTSILSDLIEMMELGDLQSKRPATLSGGQQQRVALARALVQRPPLLLLDEPLSALDHEIRIKLQSYLLRAHAEYQFTAILVSHDLPEILTLSNLIFELKEGKVLRKGDPKQLFGLKHTMGYERIGQVVNFTHVDGVASIVVTLDHQLISIPCGNPDLFHKGQPISVNFDISQVKIQPLGSVSDNE